jgi:hypothetical protein
MSFESRHLRFERPDPPPPEDPRETEQEPVSTFRSPVVVGEIVPEPTALIQVPAILARMEGITAADRAMAVILGQRALALVSIDSDDDEVLAGDLIDALGAHQALLDRKVRPFADLAFKLHRGLTGFLGQATQELVAGLGHLRPMLARRLKAKQDAEEARQREEQARARKAEQDRLLAEAVHAEAVGESPETVQQIVRDAESVPPPPVAARPITQVQGAGTRDNWKAEVTDKRALILHVADRLKADDDSLLNLLVVDTTTATQLARAQKSTMKIPGLRAINDVAFTKRRT